MPRKPVADATTMLKRVAEAIAKADGGDVQDDAVRYLQLAQAALKPLTKPTETMINAAHEAVWSDGFGDQQPPRLPEGGQGNDPRCNEGRCRLTGPG